VNQLTENQLGEHRSTYLPTVQPGKIMLRVAGACLLISLLPFSIAVQKYFTRYAVLSDRFRRDSIMINAVIGGTLILLAVILFVLYYHHKHRQVDVYADGFIFTDWLRSLAFRWDDVTEVYASPVYRNTTRGYSSNRIASWLYIVHRNDGKKVRITGLEGVSVLGKMIQSEVSKRILSQIVDAYQAGNDVWFGPRLGLSQQGIRVGGMLLPWDQVARVKLDQYNAVTILQKGKRMPWKRISSAKVANAFMLESLIYKTNGIQ
jgi:hypothetical protein